MKRLLAVSMLFCAFGYVAGGDAFAAAKAKKQAAIQKGTTVRTKVVAEGLYDQECYDLFYSCMDSFCIADNTNGGSCACSDLSIGYEKQFDEIRDILSEAERLRTIEVEKVKAGADADIVFTGMRQYDKDGNLVEVDDIDPDADKKKSRVDLSLWDTLYDEEEEDDFDLELAELAVKTGDALYSAATDICVEQVPDKCEKDLTLLRQIYSRQIQSDCAGFKNSLDSKRNAAEIELASAEGEVRAALKESLESANKLDLGQCMVSFKKCMQTDDACGKDWSRCVATIASENMQNLKAKSTAGTTVATIDVYEITPSTMEILDAKRTICENVLDECVAVRDMVWPAFLREAAMDIKLAELDAESKMRQSCLTDISDCIQKACKDDIVGKGVDTMDACLSRPDMARSFCKVQVDRCERMEPLIWGYVVDKLAAMRVDACTQEVKDCLTHETRCGSDFSNCVGMDYNYIHDMCPVDKLVVCKKNNPKFSMDDLDAMLMGLYLNIDNAAMEHCQNLVEQKMLEVCGSTTDCDKFAADDTIGSGSLRSQKDGNIYRVTGMISFGSIVMGDATGKTRDKNAEGKTVYLGPGEIAVQSYLNLVREKNVDVPDATNIIAIIEEELNNIAGTVNRVIEMIEQDPEVQFCINGRDLGQITGKKNDKTTGRFPNLLNQLKMQIAMSALRKAQTNYNEKFNDMVLKATKDASADLAQYMCQRLSATNGELAGVGNSQIDTPLAPPYAISYDVGLGLMNSDLLKGGRDITKGLETSGDFSAYGVNLSTLSIGAQRHKFSGAGYEREVWSTFSRENRMCKFCTSTVTQSCKTKKKSGFFGIGGSQTLECTSSPPVEKCEDIQM